MISKAVVRQIEQWPVDKLVPYARNPRTHSDRQIAQIAASIREFGFNNPILVDTHAGIIAGHGRLLAARKLQLAQVPVIVLDHLSEAQKRAYLVTDNKLAENAGWDEELLRCELAALEAEDFNLDLIGFDEEELARLLTDQNIVQGLTDEDAIPEIAERVVSVREDLWLLGDHKLLVGDATVREHVDRLIAGDKADLIVTDPPYNVEYQGYTEDRLTIQGDRMTAEQFQKFLSTVCNHYRQIAKLGASLYMCHASSWQREFQNALEESGFEIRCQIIWAKNTFAWGFGRYKFQHEPMFYAHVAGQTDRWYGNKSQSTLWQENKPTANRIHPTAKPVELIERALINSSKRGNVVVDLFGGSGSTLIACERQGRKARLLEIDPKYADCIVRRWQQYTGGEGVLEANGRTFDDLARERVGAMI